MIYTRGYSRIPASLSHVSSAQSASYPLCHHFYRQTCLPQMRSQSPATPLPGSLFSASLPSYSSSLQPSYPLSPSSPTLPFQAHAFIRPSFYFHVPSLSQNQIILYLRKHSTILRYFFALFFSCEYARNIYGDGRCHIPLPF